MGAGQLIRTLVLAAALGAPAAASADGTGGVTPSAPVPPASTPPNVSGGTPSGTRVPPRGRRPVPRGPVAAEFAVSPGVAYDFGTPAHVRFRVNGGSRTVRVTLVVRRLGGGPAVRRIDLGAQPTGRRLSYAWRLGSLRAGAYVLRLEAHDRRGRGLRSAHRASTTATLGVHGARFPLLGAHSYGDALDRYGAARSGHRHAGQDVLAPERTPVVAPRGGRIVATGYGGAAGYYVVLHGAASTRDYFFAHLRKGSIVVTDGQGVLTGQRLADVGHTGDAVGSHLHFEIWEGPWFGGGHTIDPLPDLRQWDSWS